jgi:hypothetical protein
MNDNEEDGKKFHGFPYTNFHSECHPHLLRNVKSTRRN